MESRQEPDAQPEKADDATDDVIELTQVIEGADDDIIELTTILEQPEQPKEPSDEAEEAIIPLVDPVDTPDEVQAVQDAEEDIIELTEPTSAADGDDSASVVDDEADDAIIELTDPAADTMVEALDEETVSLEEAIADDTAHDLPPAEEEEEIIELAGMETTLEADIPETTLEPPVTEPEDTLPAEDEEVIELMDVAAAEAPLVETEALADSESREEAMPGDDAAAEVAAERQPEAFTQPEETFSSTADAEPAEAFVADEVIQESVELPGDDSGFDEADRPEPPASSVQEVDAPTYAAEALEDDAVQTAEVSEPMEPTAAMPFAAPPADEAPTVEPVSVTEAQIEAAVERTVRTVYAEKIEQLLMQTIEKTVKQEIEKIKLALLEDDDGLPD